MLKHIVLALGAAAPQAEPEPRGERHERPREVRRVRPPRALEPELQRVTSRGHVGREEVRRDAADRRLDAVDVRVPARVPALADREGRRCLDVDLGNDVCIVAG